MISFKPNDLETVFVRSGTPMLSEVVDQVSADLALTEIQRRDIVSGIRRLCEALGRPPQETPADATWLQPRIARVAPAALKLSAKTWSNIQSNARAGLVRFGVVQKRISRKSDLSPDWLALWDTVLTSGDLTLHTSLSRFVYFLSGLGVAPVDVGDTNCEAYRAALVLNELRRDPDRALAVTTRAWNLAIKRIPEWPRQKLTVPSRQRKICIDLKEFPVGFKEDLERFLHDLEHPDPLDEAAHLKPLRQASIKQYRAMLRRFASELTLAGIDIQEIDGLEVVVRPPNAERALRRMLERASNKPTPGIADMACLIASVGRKHVKLGDADQQILDRMAFRLSGKSAPGLTRKNRERLRVFDDVGTVRRFLRMPDLLFLRAKEASTPRRALLLREEAIAIGILQSLPIRRENLCKIHLEQNLQRMGDGRVFLVFDGSQVKNGRAIEFQLPPLIVGMIDAHVAMRSPQACPAGTPWLFPRRDGGGPIGLSNLATRVKQRIKKELGATVNMHLFRHIAAKLLLEARPGQFEVVRRLLVLSNVSQAINNYAGFEAGTATRVYADVLNKARET